MELPRQASGVQVGWHALGNEGRGRAHPQLTTPIAAVWACHPNCIHAVSSEKTTHFRPRDPMNRVTANQVRQ